MLMGPETPKTFKNKNKYLNNTSKLLRVVLGLILN